MVLLEVASLVINVVMLILGAAGVIDIDELRDTEGLKTIALTIIIGIQYAYFVLAESSGKRGSLGKIIMKLEVTDLEGRQISIPRAMLRNIIKPFGFIGLIGLFFMIMTEKRQSLHDKIAKTVVINNNLK
jgi:uncharacterized RDD family membrane protein YckC